MSHGFRRNMSFVFTHFHAAFNLFCGMIVSVLLLTAPLLAAEVGAPSIGATPMPQNSSPNSSTASPQSATPITPNNPFTTPANPNAPIGENASNDPESILLQARPALTLSGEASWDEGYALLVKVIKELEAERVKHLGKEAADKAGKPFVIFNDSDDQRFKFQAMVPLPALLADKPLSGKIQAGTTPAGKALIFPHQGAYEEIDSVYEAITAYLDEKNLTAKGSFIEEFITMAPNAEDVTLDMNILILVE